MVINWWHRGRAENNIMNDSIEISAVVYGETELPESMVFSGGSEQVVYPIKLILYIVKSGKHLILIDAGCDTMPGFSLRNFMSPPVALRDAGIDSEQITDVIITHAHHDHIDGVRHFPNTVIHIQEDEYQAGKSYIPEGFRVHSFREHCVVADCLEICRIGGHSPGSCIVVLNRDEKRIVFCGDECYLRACLDRKIPTGCSCNMEISRKFVETYGSGAYRVLLSHDPEIVTGPIK